MALKSTPHPPLFPANISISRRHSSPLTEIRFSRWNNANAEPFLQRRRQQKEIEDDIRRHRRFQSATKIADVSGDGSRSCAAHSPPPDYKSPGKPSSPSSPSIRGKSSKYSTPEIPAFPRVSGSPHKSRVSIAKPDGDSGISVSERGIAYTETPNVKAENPPFSHPAFRRVSRSPHRSRVSLAKPDGEAGVSVSERGIAYKLKDAPFEFQYSYTETPKVRPLALREPPFLPFGPTTMPRPWTGRAPLPPSKKKLPEFDSFRLPPPGKKGVKSVQAPGPFLAGAGPKYSAATREEILGEPLTIEEIKELIKGSLKSKRQLNMGRDGLTHNMLDNIHALWKRRRVCKIKCKGVCTVDMDNVRQQLEEKTGGKIIYGRGGVIFLYRGRNYNYRTRPKYPLMLWKPMTPVYPRLVQRAPEGLSLEEANEMRKKGRQLPPICKLGKNGLYSNLVKNVKEAFEECELVRINCKDMNKSDCRKIGAKLRDLVSCVLVSFEYEHILMWRGREWKSSRAPSDCDSVEKFHEESLSEKSDENLNLGKDFGRDDVIDISTIDIVEEQLEASTKNSESSPSEIHSEESLGDGPHDEISNKNSSQFEMSDHKEDNNLFSPWLEGIMLLVEQAVDAGNAQLLDEEFLDADIVLAKCVSLAKKAHPGPIFQHRTKKIVQKKSEKEKRDDNEEEEDDFETLVVSNGKGDEKMNCKSRKKEQIVLDVVPYGSLGVDELAKLLA